MSALSPVVELAYAPLAVLPKRYLVVLNPRAGQGRAVRLWPELAELFRRHALEVELITSHPETLPQTLRHLQQQPDDTAVVAVGGDGTVRSLLSAVVGSARPLGIVPLGRGNDLAAALGWRAGSLREAVARLTEPSALIDVLRVSGAEAEHYCLNGLGMGFDAQVAARALQMPRALGGFGGYALAALLSMRELRTAQLEVTLGDRCVFRGPSFLCAVMNGTRYGGGFHISPKGRLDDGLADILVGAPVSRLALAPLMLRVLRGRHLSHPKVTHLRGARVTLRWSAAMDLHLDGDLGEPTLTLELELLPKAVRLLGASPATLPGAAI